MGRRKIDEFWRVGIVVEGYNFRSNHILVDEEVLANMFQSGNSGILECYSELAEGNFVKNLNQVGRF